MRRFHFFDHRKRSGSITRRFSGREDALRFLQRNAKDEDALHELRRWQARDGDTRMNDRDLLDYCARDLADRTLLVGEHIDRRTMSNVGISHEQVQSDAQPQTPRRSTRAERATPSMMREPAPKSDAKDQDTKKAEVDIDLQVATLLAAAKNGAPFCEQCAKAATEASK